MTGGEILLLGDINIDTVWPVPGFPVPGRDGLAPNVSVEVGGSVLNSAFVLDHLGQKTALISCIGKDIWAEKVKQELVQTTIVQDYIREKQDRLTGLTFIIVTPDGERTMFSHRGANVQLQPQDVSEDAFRKAGLLHISGYALLESPQKDAVWQAVKLAKLYRVPISLDTGLDPVLRNTSELQSLLRDLTICITGPQEIAAVYPNLSLDRAVEEMISSGIQLVAVKLGEKGCIVRNNRERISYPSFSIAAVDTTGAGDSFTAGILFGWVNGMGLSAIAVLGSALGALATTVYGAGSSLPDRAKLLDFLKAAREETLSFQQKDIDEVIAMLTNHGKQEER